MVMNDSNRVSRRQSKTKPTATGGVSTTSSKNSARIIVNKQVRPVYPRRNSKGRSGLSPDSSSAPLRDLIKLRALDVVGTATPWTIALTRISGVFFVLIGLVFVLFYGYLVFHIGDDPEVAQSAQLASAVRPALIQPANTASPTRGAYLELLGSAPLSGTTTLRVIAPNAKKVDFYIFAGSWTNKTRLGAGQQVKADVWEYYWNSTKVPDGTDYRFIAYVWDKSDSNDRYDYDLSLANYYSVLNLSKATTASTTVQPDPDISIKLGPKTETEWPVTIEAQDATAVEVRAENTATGVRYVLPEAKETRVGHWALSLADGTYQSGSYQLWARVIVNGQTFYSQSIPWELTNQNHNKTEATPSSSVVTELPKVSLDLNDRDTTLQGRAELQVRAAEALSVDIYILGQKAAVPLFVDSAGQNPNQTDWYLNWYTPNIPNGNYLLYAVANTVYGPLESERLPITINNQSTPLRSEVSQKLADSLAEITSSASASTTSSSSLASTVYPFFLPLHDDFQSALYQLGSARQTKATEEEKQSRARLQALLDQALRLGKFNDEAKQNEFILWFNEEITRYLAQVDRVGKIIEDRQLTNILQDSDQDGVSDYDEAAVYLTDPFDADTDDDGVIDGREIADGYDPLDSTRETPVRFESAALIGPIRSDILRVDTLTPFESEPQNSSSTKPGAVFSGVGLPRSFVTIYIYSTPLVVMVQTDADGTWRYRFDKELPDGEHTIYVGMTDNAGRIIAKSEPYRFVKTANAFASVTPKARMTLNPPPEPALLSSYPVYLVLAVSVVSIGLVLLLLGFFLESKRRVVT